jgi:translation elongation factor EF-Ts
MMKLTIKAEGGWAVVSFSHDERGTVVEVAKETMHDAFVAAIDQFREMQEEAIAMLGRFGLIQMNAVEAPKKGEPS